MTFEFMPNANHLFFSLNATFFDYSSQEVVWEKRNKFFNWLRRYDCLIYRNGRMQLCDFH